MIVGKREKMSDKCPICNKEMIVNSTGGYHCNCGWEDNPIAEDDYDQSR